ncbi:hypothetical protein T439DRAFT_378507 [Meredithblackwellia eburnea MCA 4105]
MGKIIVERVQTFCCCIPVRAGVIVLSFLTAFGAIGQIINTFSEMFYMYHNSWLQWLGISAMMIIYFFLLLIASWGFFGAWHRDRKHVEYFLIYVWYHLWANVFFGLAYLIMLSTSVEKQFQLSICVNLYREYDDGTGILQKKCVDSYKWQLVMLDIAWAIALLVQLWLVLIVSHYADELYDEECLAVGIDLDGPPPFKMRRRAKDSIAGGGGSLVDGGDSEKQLLKAYKSKPSSRVSVNSSARNSYRDYIH